MASEFEHSGGLIDFAWKAMSALVVPLIGWLWRTNEKTIEHRAAAKARMDAFEVEITGVKGDITEIKDGVGRILDHVTGTKLHGG